jgi:hypothetical protein
VSEDPRWSVGGSETESLLALARSRPQQERDSAAEQRFLSSFREHAAEQERRAARGGPGYWRYGLVFAGVLSAAVAVLEVSRQFRSEEALSYRVTRGGAEPGREIEAKSQPVQLDFSDGTSVTVEPRSRARVAETTERGARFRLDSGKMSFDVVPHPERGHWLVEAGPFRVRVTGTVFSVEWSEVAGSLDVTVTRGHVIVEGAGQRRELGPGDSFHHQDPTKGVERPPPPPALSPTAAATSRVAAKPTPKEPPTSWSELVASGSFSAVLEAVEQRGVAACLDSCSRDDLRAFVDAARLGGQAALADRALLAQRARFAGSTDAASAAFLLGRSAEARRDDRAVGWYDTYLSEAPQGRFAGDALGHKLLLLSKTDRARAAVVAREYLARFGSGPYAAHAKSLIEPR